MKRAAGRSKSSGCLVECLACGQVRIAFPDRTPHGAGECPRCGYLGWAESAELREDTRRALREQPLAERRAASR